MSGLAAAELLKLLARGMNIAEIAEERGIARTELARQLRTMAEAAGPPARSESPRAAKASATPKGARGRVVVYTDGASRGNPGPAAIGIVLMENGQVVAELGEAIGRATNNVAEYRALVTALELARGAGARELEVRMDSELVVRQLTGQYRIRDERLAALAGEVKTIARAFDRIQWVHIRRGENARADALANEALDRGAAP